jgi:hypothetical protein
LSFIGYLRQFSVNELSSLPLLTDVNVVIGRKQPKRALENSLRSIEARCRAYNHLGTQQLDRRVYLTWERTRSIFAVEDSDLIYEAQLGNDNSIDYNVSYITLRQ